MNWLEYYLLLSAERRNIYVSQGYNCSVISASLVTFADTTSSELMFSHEKCPPLLRLVMPLLNLIRYIRSTVYAVSIVSESLSFTLCEARVYSNYLREHVRPFLQHDSADLGSHLLSNNGGADLPRSFVHTNGAWDDLNLLFNLTFHRTMTYCCSIDRVNFRKHYCLRKSTNILAKFVGQNHPP
jgi:hypothetical protein